MVTKMKDGYWVVPPYEDTDYNGPFATHREAEIYNETHYPRAAASSPRTSARPNPRGPRGTLPTYGGHRPTGFDPHLPLAGREDWLIVPVARNRDSGMLDESNFEAALEILGGESDDVEVHRFGHWGPGWYEIIIVRPGSKAEKEAEEIEAALANYPVLNDEDHSQREYDATISNIRQVLSSVENKNDIKEEFPEDTAEKIFGWLWTNDQEQLENRDDQGGYPSDEAVEAALQGLGLWAGAPDEEGNAPELPEHVKQEEREKAGQRRLPGVRENPKGPGVMADYNILVKYKDEPGESDGQIAIVDKVRGENVARNVVRDFRNGAKLTGSGNYYWYQWAGTPLPHGAREASAKENPKGNPTHRLQVGNAFYTPALSGRSSWKRISNDDWEPVIVGEDEAERATLVGTRPIDGVAHNIFEMHFAPGARGYYAQMAHMTAAHEVKTNPASDAKRIDRKKLGEMMSPWGGDFAYGEGTGSVGAVASFYYGGHVYPQREYVEKAIRAIEADIPQAERGMHGWTKKDAKELRTITAGLRYYLAKDYKGGAAETNPAAKDSIEADELVLFAQNSHELYHQKQDIIANLHKKWKKGTYKPELAAKLWAYWIEAAAKRYVKEFGGGTWHKIFDARTRREAAQQVEEQERWNVETLEGHVQEKK